MYNQLAAHYSKIFPLNKSLLYFIQEEAELGCAILDLGCGTGELCHALAQEGYGCSGIDTDSEMIKIAKSAGAAAEFEVMDITNLEELQQSFNLIISTGNVMSHIVQSEFQKILESIWQLLLPGGKWVYQIVNWDKYIHSNYEFPILLRDNNTLAFYRAYAGDTDKVVFTIRLEKDGEEVYTGQSDLFPASIESHMQKNRDAGFISNGLYRDWEYGEFNGDSDNGVILVMEKK
ncbi:MAG: class I SAM-dependent methyltransferase [Fibrobacteria bacterium]|nr:class I SAM-dependent methyltransferase [Fibrobacteria bacterium]